jgi:hypothetical protein
MERFFSQQNIERYRKLLDISTDEPQRRLIFKFLAAQAHTIHMDASSLTVRVQRRGDKYAWELHRDGHFQPVKFPCLFTYQKKRPEPPETKHVRFIWHVWQLDGREGSNA